MAPHHSPHACPAVLFSPQAFGHLAAMCYASYALSQAVLYRATALRLGLGLAYKHTRPSPRFGIRIEPRAAQQGTDDGQRAVENVHT